MIANSAVALALLTAPVVPQGSGETIVVSSIDKTGENTLRQALLDAQNGDTITFDPSVFPPDAPVTISLTRELPHILRGNLTIDASDAGVILDGSGITTSEAYGLSIPSSNNIIRGLQIVNFSQAGIGLNGGANNNIIGGDRDKGEGPLGQGNLVSGDGTFGIGLWGNGTSFNTIQGNIVGTDVSGTVRVGQFIGGIFIEGANHNLIESNLIGGYVDNGVEISGVSAGRNTVRGNHIGTDASGVIQLTYSSSYGVQIGNSGHNVIGPSNVIAHNRRSGIIIGGEESVGNRITENSLYDNGGVDINGGLGIELWHGGNLELTAPAIFDFDMQAGTVTGVACANCTVEVFSDNADEGEIYEGRTTADPTGLFLFTKGAPFSRSRLTATATDTNGNTSQFSVYTPDTAARTASLQGGNNLPRARLQTRRSDELADNRIGGSWQLEWAYDLGLKRSRLIYNAIEENGVDWDRSDFDVSPGLDEEATRYAAHGVTTHMTLNFWDKDNHPGGWTEPAGFSRFRNDEDIQRYVVFARFVVDYFKDRVQYYELWNEPDNGGFPIQHIRVPDYVKLVQEAAPAIRKEYREAKIMVSAGANLIYQLDYMFDLVSADGIMELVDVVCWHPFYGQSPAYEDAKDYYDRYPSIVQEIKDTAYAHGFRGEYFVDEVSWDVEGSLSPSQYRYSEIQSAKYYARGIVTHLGLDVTVEVAGPPPFYVTQYATVQNLCTLMAGTSPDSVPVEIQSEAANLRSYGFSSANGDKLVALWTDGVAVDDDPGVTATIILPGLADLSITGIDVLNGFQQEMITEFENGNLVIRDLLVKDYPIILRSTSLTPTGILGEGLEGPATYELGDNYPNPFNPTTSIAFQVPQRSHVSIKIYNLIGQELRDLVGKHFGPGLHRIEWSGLDNEGKIAATGMYLIHMKSDDYVKTKKCLLLR